MEKIKFFIVLIITLGAIFYLFPFFSNFLRASLGVGFASSNFYYSLDGGETFLKQNRGLLFVEINDLVIAPKRGVIYALTNQGVFQNSNLNGGWQRIKDQGGILKPPIKVQRLIFLDDKEEQILLALTKNNRGYLYFSNDGLRTLKEVYRTGYLGEEIFDLKINPLTQKIFFSTNQGQLIVSSDQGKSYQLLKYFDQPIQIIAFSPLDSSRMILVGETKIYEGKDSVFNELVDLGSFGKINKIFLTANRFYLATNQGAWQSFDGGKNWQIVDSLLPQNLPALEIAYNNIRKELLVAFDGAMYFSSDLVNWRMKTLDQTNLIKIIKIHPTNPHLIFVALGR